MDWRLCSNCFSFDLVRLEFVLWWAYLSYLSLFLDLDEVFRHAWIDPEQTLGSWKYGLVANPKWQGTLPPTKMWTVRYSEGNCKLAARPCHSAVPVHSCPSQAVGLKLHKETQQYGWRAAVECQDAPWHPCATMPPSRRMPFASLSTELLSPQSIPKWWSRTTYCVLKHLETVCWMNLRLSFSLLLAQDRTWNSQVRKEPSCRPRTKLDDLIMKRTASPQPVQQCSIKTGVVETTCIFIELQLHLWSPQCGTSPPWTWNPDMPDISDQVETRNSDVDESWLDDVPHNLHPNELALQVSTLFEKVQHAPSSIQQHDAC